MVKGDYVEVTNIISNNYNVSGLEKAYYIEPYAHHKAMIFIEEGKVVDVLNNIVITSGCILVLRDHLQKVTHIDSYSLW